MPLPTEFRWKASPPLVSPRTDTDDTFFSIKDPTVVRHDGRWHLFCTVRGTTRSHQIEHVSFDSWEDSANATRAFLTTREGYFCAPQVFYFRPHQRWYLLYQVGEEGRKLGLQPAFSTTETIDDPTSWTPAALIFPNEDPAGVDRWIDFWIICDEDHAYLFFTSLDGRLWRMSAPLPEFPHGFSNATVAHQDSHPEWRLFEASHTYRLKGMNQYLTIVEAEDKTRGNRRFFLSYVADRLDGDWTPLAASLEHPFGIAENVSFDGEAWTEYVSHGELIRASNDERMEVDPSRFQFLIQGVRHEQVGGKPYGQIPWRLGLLTQE
ncbi:MAG: non-reducing end alpha-L-arabinofuranosidase family hydrolase [Candidatus Poribacteria bacterium]|nr:non-reducing end alpha-L-arabinofuranosidase family hydrolase [Candidatus Poribacteria bacterium]